MFHSSLDFDITEFGCIAVFLLVFVHCGFLPRLRHGRICGLDYVVVADSAALAGLPHNRSSQGCPLSFVHDRCTHSNAARYLTMVSVPLTTTESPSWWRCRFPGVTSDSELTLLPALGRWPVSLAIAKRPWRP